MSDTPVLPGSLTLRNLFEDLLGREIDVHPGTPITGDDLPTATIAVYIDPVQQIYGVVGMQLTLAANVGAALGLLPAGAAEDSIARKQLLPNLAESVFELCNLLTGLLNREGAPYVALHQVVFPGMPLPTDARARLLAPGRRLDLDIEVARYGRGKFSLSLAP